LIRFVVVVVLVSLATCAVQAQQPSAPQPRVRHQSHVPPDVVLYDAVPTVDGTPIDDMARWMAAGGKPLAPENLQPQPVTEEALLLPVELSCKAIGGSAFDFYVGATNPPPLLAANAPSCKMAVTQGNPGQTIYWRVVAKNAVGMAASGVRSFVVGGSSILVVGADLTSSGTWVGTRGRDGYWLATDGRLLPSYATVTVTGAETFTWESSTEDTRALQKPTPGPGELPYLAATWYSGTSFDVTITVTDGQLHQVALYLLDWDSVGARAERIDAIDATSGAVVDSRTARDFAGGGYLIYVISGRVTFRLTHVVVSGIFFDPPASSIALTWEANAAAEAILRYEIGFGTTRGSYPSTRSVGLSTQWTVEGIPEDGKPWWIAVRAVNAEGASAWSQPIALLFKPPVAPSRR
jgi:hypothetical protein